MPWAISLPSQQGSYARRAEPCGPRASNSAPRRPMTTTSCRISAGSTVAVTPPRFEQIGGRRQVATGPG